MVEGRPSSFPFPPTGTPHHASETDSSTPRDRSAFTSSLSSIPFQQSASQPFNSHDSKMDDSIGHAASQSQTTLSPLNTLSAPAVPSFHIRSPSSANTAIGSPHNLHLQTNSLPPGAGDKAAAAPELAQGDRMSTPPIPIPGAQQPLKSTLSAMSIASHHSLSPGSVISSPALAAMTDITPLPSPLLPGDSPGPWKRAALPRPGSAGSLKSLREDAQVQDFSTGPPSTSGSRRSSLKKKAYSNLNPTSEASMSAPSRPNLGHQKSRSLSEYTPEALHNVRQRNITVSEGTKETQQLAPTLHREEYLAAQRGLVIQQPTGRPPGQVPTPPPSNRSVTESETEESMRDEEVVVETITVRDIMTGRKTKYRPVRPLGQGTFSKVVLATNQRLPSTLSLTESTEASLDPRYLVAIKIVGHGPAGGADEERVELSLKREVEILKSISHPSLIHLKSYDFNDAEAMLVLNYCPGGDLFDLASTGKDLLNPSVVQRLFSELVSAVAYLHSKRIVHRDIKLENVLLNLPLPALAALPNPLTHPHPLITLTDLGLSRLIPLPPKPPHPHHPLRLRGLRRPRDLTVATLRRPRHRRLGARRAAVRARRGAPAVRSAAAAAGGAGGARAEPGGASDCEVRLGVVAVRR